MIKSMTGYGKSVSNFGEKIITVEVKTLNSKSFNLYTKIPENYSDKELILRNETIKILEKGKISVTVNIESEKEKLININTDAIDQYYSQISKIAEKYNHDIKNENIFQVLLKMPEVLTQNSNDDNGELWEIINETFKKALHQTDKYRIDEGKAIENDIIEKIKIIYSFIPELEKYEQERIELIKERLQAKLNEYIEKNDQNDNRFEQELIYYLDKFDLNEEKSRLTKHCDYFMETVKNSDSNGNKLGFIVQEIGREINTIGSKANHADIQKIVVIMKDELGKIKEQTLNIL